MIIRLKEPKGLWILCHTDNVLNLLKSRIYLRWQKPRFIYNSSLHQVRWNPIEGSLHRIGVLSQNRRIGVFPQSRRSAAIPESRESGDHNDWSTGPSLSSRDRLLSDLRPVRDDPSSPSWQPTAPIWSRS